MIRLIDMSDVVLGVFIIPSRAVQLHTKLKISADWGFAGGVKACRPCLHHIRSLMQSRVNSIQESQFLLRRLVKARSGDIFRADNLIHFIYAQKKANVGKGFRECRAWEGYMAFMKS
jgi:hypothetical protein